MIYRYEKATLYPFSEKMGRKFTILKWKCLLELIGHEQNCLFSDVVMGTWSPTSQSSTTLGDSWTKLEMLLNSWQLVIPKQKPFGLMNPCPLPNHQPRFGSLPIADLKCADSEMAQPKIRNFKCLFFLSEIQKNSGFSPTIQALKKTKRLLHQALMGCYILLPTKKHA